MTVSTVLGEPAQNPDSCNPEIRSSLKSDPEFSLNYITE